MKSKNLLGKLLVVTSFATVFFIALAGFSINKLYQEDPNVLSKLILLGQGEDNWFKFERNSGVNFNLGHSNSNAETHDQWTIGGTKKRITIKTFSGSFEVKRSKNTDIQISATGNLDKSLAQQLLEIDDAEDELTIQQPKDDAVKNLNFVLEVPEEVVESLDIFSANSDYLVSGLKMNVLNFKTVSGDVVIRGVSAEEVEAKTVQGDLRFEDSEFKEVSLKSVSGDIDLNSTNPGNANIVSVSGSVRLNLVANTNYQFSLNSISGNITNNYGASSGKEYKISVSTTSGDIEIDSKL